MKSHMHISEGVEAALEARRPVVALESTVIAHGLPCPSNMETALAVEKIIRDAGAVPATIAVLGGQIRVGLSREEIERLASSKDILKLGTRDLPTAIASGADGATTVSATAFIACKAGIEVFVTGGIGGVHRGAERTLDISSDVWELTKSSIIVVCAGAKAILDVSATLEWLETQQVPVVGYQTSEFPGFYSRHTGFAVDRVETPEEIAARFETQRSLGMPGAMLVAVPVTEEYELDVSSEIACAVEEASAQSIKGKELTPWLLARLDELTGGQSVATNIALLKNNAQVGAEIAQARAGMRDE
ncbi:MAG TPA: pseudouridine-5'-phosphate glycosidase [Armatimonadota bacterium]|nr:pseudouridine-5'-phosphate glycosidase [Armatimonadota bacterium]